MPVMDAIMKKKKRKIHCRRCQKECNGGMDEKWRETGRRDNRESWEERKERFNSDYSSLRGIFMCGPCIYLLSLSFAEFPESGREIGRRFKFTILYCKLEVILAVEKMQWSEVLVLVKRRKIIQLGA